MEICRVEVWHTASDRTVTELIGSLIWPNALRAIESSFIEICALDRGRSNPIRICQTLAPPSRSSFSNRANCTRRDLKAGTRLTISVSIFHRCTCLGIFALSLSIFDFPLSVHSFVHPSVENAGKGEVSITEGVDRKLRERSDDKVRD